METNSCSYIFQTSDMFHDKNISLLSRCTVSNVHKFIPVLIESIARGGHPGSHLDRSTLGRGLKPCTERCFHKSCLVRGKDPYTGSQSRPSDWDTRHHGSILLSGKRAGHPQYNLAGRCRRVWGPLVYRCLHCIGRPGCLNNFLCLLVYVHLATWVWLAKIARC